MHHTDFSISGPIFYLCLCKVLTHWGRVMHIFVSRLNIISSDGRQQAIVWIKAGIMLIQTLGTNFGEILSKICTFSFKKMHFKMVVNWSQPQCVKWCQYKIYYIWKAFFHWLGTFSTIARKWSQIKIQQFVAGAPLIHWLNSLWHKDVIWCCRSGQTLVQA